MELAPMRPLIRLLLAALVASMLLTACGNKGLLVLPTSPGGQPVKVDAPAPPSTAGLDHTFGAPVGY
jgi:predicted small lipoprotein YifL